MEKSLQDGLDLKFNHPDEQGNMSFDQKHL